MSVDLIRKAGSAGSKLVRQWRWTAVMNRDPGAPGFSGWTAPVTEPRLVMSELLVLGGLILALIWSRFTKFIPFETTFGVNHFPSLFVITGVLLTMIGAALRPRDRSRLKSSIRPGRVLWPLLILATWVIAGSIYAQTIEKTGNTFRNLGLYMLAAYLLAWVMVLSRSPMRLASIYFALLVVAGVTTVLVQIGVFFTQGPTAAPFHELEFFIIPLVVYVATRKREMKHWDLIIVWGGILSVIFFQKNSGYLTAVGTTLYLWIMHWRVTVHRSIAIKRALHFLVGGVLMVIVVGVYIYLRSSSDGLVPTGNTEFRLYKYEKAWQLFLESPIWGTFFAEPATAEFTLYDTGVAGNILPTHSDTLDILANGGLMGFGLWLGAHILIFMTTNRHILTQRDFLSSHLVAITHTLTCMMLLGIVTYSFNPLLLNPVRALLIWSQIGLLVGLVCICVRNQELSSQVRPTT